MKTKKEFEQYFRLEILPSIKAKESEYKTGRYSVDLPMRREAWNNLIDCMVKDNQLPKRSIDWECPW